MTTTTPGRMQDLAGAAVAHLASRLARTPSEGGLSPGDLAEMRRTDPHGPLPPVMWRLLTADSLQDWLGSTAGSTRERAERALAVVAQAVVLAGTPGALSIGKALGATGYAEQRFVRLLRARGPDDVAHTALAAARWCATKAAALGITAGPGRFGHFILAAALDLPDADRRAHTIARDYFATPAPGGTAVLEA